MPKAPQIDDLVKTVFFRNNAESAVTQDHRDRIFLEVARLKERQRLVLEWTYGLNGQPVLEQADIALRLNTQQPAVSNTKKTAINNICKRTAQEKLCATPRTEIHTLRARATALFKGVRDSDLDGHDPILTVRRAEIDRAMNRLDPLHAQIIDMAFGLENKDACSNQQIQNMLGLPQQTISYAIKTGLTEIFSALDAEDHPFARNDTDTSGPDDGMCAADNAGALTAAFAKISGTPQENALQLFARDFPLEKTRLILEKPLGTVKSFQHRSLAKLRGALSAKV